LKKKISISKDIITAPSLDNKVGCLTILEVMNSIKESKDKTFIFCFACREEISLNGLMQAVRQYNPDICIDVDSAYALPVSFPAQKRNWQIPTIGKGPAIQLMGNGFIIRSDNRFFVESVAKENNISYQYEIPDGENGGTNASTLISAGYDTIQINVPVSNQHSAESKASLEDINTSSILLQKVLEAL
jgi:putative aminopeptidase FrvX